MTVYQKNDLREGAVPAARKNVTQIRAYDDILDTVGNTPVVRIRNLAPDHVEIYAKLEAFNPMGSVKDRLALGILEEAERSGALKPGQTVIEATSGNTGIGLAMVCAAKGYPLVIVMAESFSVERRRLMRFLGAKVILTPAAEKGSGMLAKATELAEKHGWFLCQQFENEANARVHYDTTAREILDCFEGEKLDYWLSGFGTGGTLKGVATRLKEERPDTRVVVCEPDNAPILSGGANQNPAWKGGPAGSHPLFRPHVMQGWSPDFISPLTEQANNDHLIDAYELIEGGKAMVMSRELARCEGILTGITGGATFAGALQLAEKSPPGTRILCMLPDTGERYLSTPLFEDIDAEMNEEEIRISRSTAGYRFDSNDEIVELEKAGEVQDMPGKSLAAEAPLALMASDAGAFIEQALTDRNHPVVVFGLAWCEFGWSVTKFFDEIGVPYRNVQIDRAEFRENDLGIQIRAGLEQMTGVKTFPQVFIDGRFAGGCTDIFNAHTSGGLAERLALAGVDFATEKSIDPYSLLPKWIHTRA